MIRRSRFPLLSAPLALAFVACGQGGSQVYVLEEPQSVTLIASASATSVKQGDPVVLRVERRTSGKWKLVPLSEVRAGQCWVHRPPASAESEVADSVQWEVSPEEAVAFNAEYRLDHTKIATMNVKGTITLKPLSAVKCEADRVVEGPAIQIEVS
jgi:hypothetical protein